MAFESTTDRSLVARKQQQPPPQKHWEAPVPAAARVLSSYRKDEPKEGNSEDDSRGELNTVERGDSSGRRVLQHYPHRPAVTEKKFSRNVALPAYKSTTKPRSIIKPSTVALRQISEDKSASFRSSELDYEGDGPSMIGDSPSVLSTRSAVTFGNVEVREDSLIRGAVTETVEEYEASKQRKLPKEAHPSGYSSSSLPKDAPTKKSYETPVVVRVQAKVVAAPKARQVAHDSSERTAASTYSSESLYGDFEDKFQSGKQKKKGGGGGFFGWFKRRSAKKRNVLEHM